MHVHYGGPNSFSKINYNLQQENPQSRDHSLLDLVKKTHRRPDGIFSDPYIEGIVRAVEKDTSQYEDTSSTAYSQGDESYTQRVNRLYLEKVNPNYGEAYGVGSANTQFYQLYIPYPSSTQGDLRGEFEAFKTTTQERLNRLEAGSSAGPGQVPRDTEDLIFLYKRNCLFTIVRLFTVSKK